MPTIESIPLQLDELLAAEFAYIADSANQANEDRARVSSFYLIAVGSLVAALFSTQFFDPESVTKAINIMFSGLFILLTLLGASTIMQLARLRAAWYESALAMNQIKEFMVAKNENFALAFRWTTETLPPKFKPNSVSYFQAVEVACISGVMFGAALFFLQRAFFSISLFNWFVSILGGLLALFIQLAVYKRLL
jgi:hypothetical protein